MPRKKKTYPIGSDPKASYQPKLETTKILIENTPFIGGLPLEVVENIELFTRRRRGRPTATPQQKTEAIRKQREKTRMRARAEKQIELGNLNEAKAIVDDMKNKGMLGDRAISLYQKIYKLEEMKQMEEQFGENKILEELSSQIANESLEQAQQELAQEDTRRKKLRGVLDIGKEEKEKLKEEQFLKKLKEDEEGISTPQKEIDIPKYSPEVVEQEKQKIKEELLKLKNLSRKDRLKAVLEMGKDEKELEQMTSELATKTLEEAQRELTEELVKTKNISPQEAQKQVKKMSAVKQFTSEKEKLLEKENKLVFGELAKSKSTTTQSDLQHNFTSVDKSKPIEDKPKTNIPYATMPKQLRNYLRDYLRDNFDLVPDYDETEFVMDNFVDDETKQMLLENNSSAAGKIGEIIQNARETARFVPKDIEGNEQMTKEERQILFHKLMIENRSVREDVIKGKTNFDNYNMMSGGVNAGLETKSKKDEESVPIKLPDVFKDYEFILDSKIKDNAESRELFKGINPNAVIDSGNEELIAAYFSKMNELSNEQDTREINEAVDNIEILSGGNRDTLFGATDLLTTKSNYNVRFNQDQPDDIRDNPAPLNRGRDAQAVSEVELEKIKRQNRADYTTTIASGIGILGNAYRGIFGKNDIPASRGQNDILDDINQNMRLIGKRGLYGDDKSLKTDDSLYEGVSFDKRLSSLREFKNQRILGEKETDNMDALREAMMFNRGAGGAQGATLQQLRQQEFAYKQANRSTAHDGRQFIRGGRGTQIKIEQEYDP